MSTRAYSTGLIGKLLKAEFMIKDPNITFDQNPMSANVQQNKKEDCH